MSLSQQRTFKEQESSFSIDKSQSKVLTTPQHLTQWKSFFKYDTRTHILVKSKSRSKMNFLIDMKVITDPQFKSQMRTLHETANEFSMQQKSKLGTRVFWQVRELVKFKSLFRIQVTVWKELIFFNKESSRVKRKSIFQELWRKSKEQTQPLLNEWQKEFKEKLITHWQSHRNSL